MAPSLLPINLTTRADELRRVGSSGPKQPVFTGPGFRCDQIDASGLRAEHPASAAHDEVYVILAGQGRVSGADDSLMDVTASDVVYVPRGAARRFENLSKKFLTLRLSIGRNIGSSD